MIDLKYTKKLLENQEYLAMVLGLECKERQRPFCRHGLSHSLDVARIAWIIMLEQTIQEDMDAEHMAKQKDKIYLTALLHDLGRIWDGNELARDHALDGIPIAHKLLNQIDYPDKEAREIVDAIREHSGEIKTNRHLINLIQTADKHSRNCFFCDAQKKCYWSEERKNKTISW